MSAYTDDTSDSGHHYDSDPAAHVYNSNVELEEVLTVTDRLPTPEEYHILQALIIRKSATRTRIGDVQLFNVVQQCPYLERVVLSGVPDTSDKTIVTLAEQAVDLESIDITGCSQVTDVGVMELVTQSPLQSVKVNGVTGLTDPSISAIAKSCARLVELELADLPLISPISVRDIWSYSR